jgi:hypothetical protein
MNIVLIEHANPTCGITIAITGEITLRFGSAYAVSCDAEKRVSNIKTAPSLLWI